MIRAIIVLSTFLALTVGAANSESSTLIKVSAALLGPVTHTFELNYAVTIPVSEHNAATLDVFIPLAQSDAHQEIISREIKSDFSGTIQRDKVYGNEFWHGRLNPSPEKDQKVLIRYTIRRKANIISLGSRIAESGGAVTSYPRISRFLEPDSRVPTSGRIIDLMLKDIPATIDDSPLQKARAVYDFVIDNMEYKKVGTGWGQGDTYWACSMKYGNCTDFHALFISLSRALKVPTRFEIGFPVPLERSSGKIDGYHCWASVYIPQIGWIPVDASEAKKHPELKDFLFGNQPADRVGFTIGRDIELGVGHSSMPLNFFIYPYAEANGEAVKSLPLEITYRDTSTEYALDNIDANPEVKIGL